VTAVKPYRIPAGHGESAFVEKKSKFIGRVWPVESEQEAQALLKSMREAHWDANHNVYGYILRDGNSMRYSDDGEPQGTAGQPVLHVLERQEITNVLCVVTRYFGGTLLGAGGLVRAYSHGAKIALEAAGIAEVRPWRQLELICTYAQYERLSKIAAEQGAVIEHTDFGADVTLSLLVSDSEGDAFCAHMTEVSAGTILLEQMGIQELAVKIES